MKILYIGSGGDLSLQPLRYLLHSEHQLCAVAVDLPSYSNARLSVVSDEHNTVESLARVSALPVIDLSAPPEECLASIKQLSPDLVLVSCYARKLPQALLDIPVLGCFNLHPSSLPAYRGPSPLFWQFRDGLSEFGVSLHRMSGRLDAGDIVARSSVVMPDGVGQIRAQQLLAEAYVELMPGFLSALSDGSLLTEPQDETTMTYQGFPTLDDFRVDTTWPAKRIFNFICATSIYGAVYPCAIDGTDYYLQNVLGYTEEQLPERKCVIDGNTIQIVCDPGVLLARLAPTTTDRKPE